MEKNTRGSTKTTDKVLAEKVEARMKSDLIRNKYDIPGQVKADHSLSEVWKDYLKSIVNVPSTLSRKKTAANHFLKALGNVPVEEINQLKIKEYQINRRLEFLGAKNSPRPDTSLRSVNIELSTLSHVFNFCIEKGYIGKNPVSGVKKLFHAKRNILLTREEQDRLISCAAPHVRHFI